VNAPKSVAPEPLVLAEIDLSSRIRHDDERLEHDLTGVAGYPSEQATGSRIDHQKAGFSWARLRGVSWVIASEGGSQKHDLENRPRNRETTSRALSMPVVHFPVGELASITLL
jgi:hypothetical protein